jgi:two-component system, NtrC family, response regulator AtoC
MASPSIHSEPNTKRILICDDDPLFRKTLSLLLREQGTVVATQNTDEALALLKTQTFDLLILDIQMRTPDEGMRAIPLARALNSEMTIVILSGLEDFRVVRDALHSGANDYLTKDFDPDEFRLTIERALGSHHLRKVNRKRNSEAARAAKRYQFIGESPEILEIKKRVEKFRIAEPNVLIRGETGTGKEIIARLLRKIDADGNLEPFVAIDSATLHANTAESILFGHERGAFTGADSVRAGLFEEADGGVVFFDEIGNMPLEIQAKLLRVLQEKEVTRLGSHRTIPLQFRVIAATSRPIEEMAEKGLFLPDLIHRLNVLPITLPPLRDRTGDIPLLVTHFLNDKTGGKIEISEEALALLSNYSWPGNVRELSALLDYSIALVEDNRIEIADLHQRVLAPKVRKTEGQINRKDFYSRLAVHEAAILSEAYSEASGNISKLAIELGMDRSHLYSKLKQHGIHTSKTRG